MTSVASYDAATTAGNFTLVGSGVTFPNTFCWMEDFTTRPILATDVNVRQNFWASSVVLDGRYPALYFEHSFKMFCEATSTTTPFSQQVRLYTIFTSISSAINGNLQPLEIRDGNTANARIHFGPSYLKDWEYDEDFLKYGCGFFTLNWVSTNVPSVVA